MSSFSGILSSLELAVHVNTTTDAAELRPPAASSWLFSPATAPIFHKLASWGRGRGPSTASSLAAGGWGGISLIISLSHLLSFPSFLASPATPPSTGTVRRLELFSTPPPHPLLKPPSSPAGSAAEPHTGPRPRTPPLLPYHEMCHRHVAVQRAACVFKRERACSAVTDMK